MKWPVFNLSPLNVVFIFFISCAKQQMPDNNPVLQPVPVSATASLRYLALGDSYTIGQSVTEQERFPYLTAALLRAQHINIADPTYIATTGWTTANLLTAINQESALGTYDVVSLLIGVNDQYQHLDTAGYRDRFTQLLDKAIALTANRTSRVFVLSIPDYSATPFVSAEDKSRVHQEIDAFNAINKEITLRNAVAYVDITPQTQKAATDVSLLANDHLHYSGKEHQHWADQLAPRIRESLQ